MTKLPLILASSSKSRLSLLKNIGIIPDKIIPSNIDETPLKKEKPSNLASRLSNEKAKKVSSLVKDGYILAADSVSARGNLILPKAENNEDVRYCMEIYSGRRHNVYTGVTILKIIDYEIADQRHRLVKSIVKFKRLTNQEIEAYIRTKEGIGKGGGICISGYAQIFISFISNSYSNIMGLPLFETRNMLLSLGYDILR